MATKKPPETWTGAKSAMLKSKPRFSPVMVMEKSGTALVGSASLSGSSKIQMRMVWSSERRPRPKETRVTYSVGSSVKK
ncbi:MAG: hypothetical protein EA378_08890 [Phycisphaerales bacterium]|nr:MAG: hypothetical protein EA378_08890 [Phycisphaerales bacterium]